MRALVKLRAVAIEFLRRLAIAAVVLAPASLPVSAAPKPAVGYHVDVVSKPGAIFSGLASDGDALLLTDLADGRLYRYGPDGQFTAFGPVLPHGLDVIGDPTGPYRIARYGAHYLVTQGWTPVDGKEGPLDHALLEVDGSSVKVVSNDFLNPFAFRADGDALYVIDAAQNSIERLTDGGRRKATLFTFARLGQPAAAMSRLSPTEFSDNGSYEFDAVPTGLAAWGDRLYISLFGGFPFIAGSGRIVSLPTTSERPSLRIEADALNAPVDVAFAADGSLLILEHGLYDVAGGFRADSGRLLRISSATGKPEVVLDGLTRPSAVLVLDAHNIVISELGGTLVFLSRGGQ